MTTPITSTYRLQLRGDAFTLRDAASLADYLDDLGVSHVYLSPLLTATEGSTHGYDVTDPTTVSAALGGRAALIALAQELRRRRMGIVVDLVPNHVGIGEPQANAWWWDVLTHGRKSRYADYFDIDWDADNGADGRVALPVLGSESDRDAVTVDRSGPLPLLAFHEHRFPIAPGTDVDDPRTVQDAQSYRLVAWSAGLVGYRRFFTINELAGVRQEDPRVFDASHAEFRSWVRENLIDGVRIDHPDGLSDPAGYLERVRTLIGPERWLVIEKILGPAEPLDPALPVDGTTGYDALAQIGGAFLDPPGAAVLTQLSAERTGDPGDAAWLREREYELKRAAAETGLAPEVRRLVRAVTRAAPTDVDPAELAEAVVEVVAAIPVYRCDYGPSAGLLGRVMSEVAGSRPSWERELSVLAAALIADPEVAARFHQLCGAAKAKAVEDCHFYRTARLVSLQEVGGDPGKFGTTPAEFHLANSERAQHWPRAMTTLSTHDTKRGEDVRARIGVLSQVPQVWVRCVATWERITPSPDAATGLFLWQNLFGVWPGDGRPGAAVPDLRARIHQYATKAIREAGVHTTWSDVDDAFEDRVHTWLDDVIDGPVGHALGSLASQLAPHAWSDSLGQKLLQLCGPGIPDVYQGTELWEDSLVDPDNRRLVDFAVRRAAAAALAESDPPVLEGSGMAKLLVVRTALRLRRERPESFDGGTYAPILADGPAAAHLIGFARGRQDSDPDVIALATRLSVRLGETGWDETAVRLPSGTWTDLLTHRDFTGPAPVAELFRHLPVALLVGGSSSNGH